MKKQAYKPKKLCRFWLISAIAVILLTVLLLWQPWRREQTQCFITVNNVRTAAIDGFSDTADAARVQTNWEDFEVCRIGTYSGVFVEQGTDIACKDIPAVIVHNKGSRMIERAQLRCGEEIYIVTYLPPDGICLVQEYTGSDDSSIQDMHIDSVTYAAQYGMHEDCVRVTSQPGRIVIENISGEDISGSVNVWYKTVWNGLYFGGVSYKAAVDDGVLKADAIATVQTTHYNIEESKLLLVTFEE